jgi:erythromycin esterase-like protein
MCVLAACLGATAINGSAQDPKRRTAERLDPTSVILDAFTSHSVVALGEGAHGNLLGHAFRLALIRDPRFAAVVNDIVVESGSATYQSLMDRYVRGEAVPESTLRDVRENTVTATPAWDRPMFDEFFQAVRDLNQSLPRERQLRFLLGDPPIDWSAVKNADDYRRILLQRDSHPADLIRREVLAQRTTGAGDLRRRSLPGEN